MLWRSMVQCLPKSLESKAASGSKQGLQQWQDGMILNTAKTGSKGVCARPTLRISRNYSHRAQTLQCADGKETLHAVPAATSITKSWKP